jgi:hypothetical protein
MDENYLKRIFFTTGGTNQSSFAVKRIKANILLNLSLKLYPFLSSMMASAASRRSA